MKEVKEVENIEVKIIEAAKKQFTENGFKKTSMSDIAAAAGINRPTLHYYFHTKDKMFEAVFSLVVQSFMPKIELIAVEDISFEEKLGKIIDQYLIIYKENPDLPQFVIGEIQRDPDHLLSVMKKLGFDNYLVIFGRLINIERKKGNLKQVPEPILLLTFFSQLTFPFLSRNMIKKLFELDDEGFGKLITEWKPYIIMQIKMLLFK